MYVHIPTFMSWLQQISQFIAFCFSIIFSSTLKCLMSPRAISKLKLLTYFSFTRVLFTAYIMACKTSLKPEFFTV